MRTQIYLNRKRGDFMEDMYTIKIDNYEVRLKLDEPEYTYAIRKLLNIIQEKYPNSSVYMKDEEYGKEIIK